MKIAKKIFWVFTTLFFMAQESWAMEKEDENKNIILCVKPALPESDSIIDDENYIEVLPDETLTHVFTFLNVDDLGRIAQVSSRWKRVGSDPQLWRELGFRKYGDYLTEEDLRENPRKMVIQHYLSVLVNAEKDLERISMLVQRYDLGSYFPQFKKHINFDFLLDMIKSQSDFEELIAQGNSVAIKRKIEGLAEGKYGYKKDLNACRNFNDLLIERGDEEALERKIWALSHGGFTHSYEVEGTFYTSTTPTYGYKRNSAAAVKLNDARVEKGNQQAIKWKIEGLAGGNHGYKKNPAACREFNEILVERGVQDAIHAKIMGFLYGKRGGLVYEYGYEKNPAAAVEFNETLVEKGDQKAIERKREGLEYGRYGYERKRGYDVLVERGDREAIHRKIEGHVDGKNGYEKNPVAAVELNEVLIEKGDEKAIERKRRGLLYGQNGYEKNSTAHAEFNEILVEKEDREAIHRKIKGLAYGENGYEKNPVAAVELNETLIETADQEAIGRKIEGLVYGRHGYEKNPAAVVEFNEILVEKGDQKAIERKREGLAYGRNGYEKNPAATVQLNEALVEKGDIDAIKRKIAGLVYGRSGYEKNPVAARAFIEDLALSEFSSVRAFGKYLKVLDLKYGITKLGYGRSLIEAVAFIREYNVPF